MKRATVLFAFFAVVPAAAADAVTLSSLDGQVQLRLAVREEGALGWSVSFRMRPVIEMAPLGIVVDGVNLAAGAELGKAERYRVNETYPWHGVHSTAVNRCNGIRIAVTHKKTGASYTLEARAYNDGVAFRFLVPGPDETPRVPEEATLFRIPAGSTVWYHDFEGHYEAVHTRREIGEVPAGAWAAPPVTFKLPANAGYASITEGALLRYSGMGLQADGQRGFHARLGHAHPVSYPFRLRFKDSIEQMARPAAIAGPITTPWRIVMVGPDLNTLVNCDIVHNVSSPPDPKLFPDGIRTRWIKPGRAVWRYLDGGETTLAGIKEFSRMAGELGFEYQVIEGFWAKWSQSDLKELIEYSRSQGVGIWLWRNSRDLRDSASRRKFFELCRNSGAAGVKLDFYDHEAKEVVELYEASLKEAAEFELLVNFHGANKPTGESRTWPNELTREAIRGMESRKVERAPHNAALPFTRMLAGHADYTPTHFGERRNDTTWAHQVASAAIFTSPLLTYAAHPQAMLRNPAAGMIRSIPSVWDETIALPVSEIGRIAAFARRRGDLWFVAILNGAAGKRIDVPLSFLGGGSYKALLVRDSPRGADAVEVQDRVVRRADSLEIELQAGGGFIGRFAR